MNDLPLNLDPELLVAYVDKELPPAVKERIQKKARDELTPAIIKKCGADKGVEAAFNRMGAGRG